MNLPLILVTLGICGLLFALQRWLYWSKDCLPLLSLANFKTSFQGGVYAERKKHGPTFSLNLFQTKLHVVTTPKDITKVTIEKDANLSLWPFVDKFIGHIIYGDDLAAEKRILDDGPHPLRPLLIEYIKAQLNSKEYLQKLASTFEELAVKTCKKFAEEPETKFLQTISNYVLSCSITLLYGADFLARHPEFPSLMFQYESNAVHSTSLAAPWLPFGPPQRFKELKQQARKLTIEEIASRKEKFERGETLSDDYITRVLKFESECPTKNSLDGWTSHIVSFVISAHLNTAASLAWNLLYLAKRKNFQDRVRKYADESQDFAALNGIPFLDLMIKEAIRLYGNLVMAPRKVQMESFTLENGKKVPQGEYVIPYPGFMQDIFPDLEVFDPERWERKEAQNVTGFYPFGGGPHACMGRNVASLIIKTMFKKMLSSYELDIEQVPEIDRSKAAGLVLPLETTKFKLTPRK